MGNEAECTEAKKAGNVSVGIGKYVLILLNVLYLLIALLIIICGTFGEILHFKTAFIWSGIDVLSILWLSTGGVLLFAALFGLIAAFNESSISISIYGVLMGIAFTAQIACTIVAFNYISDAKAVSWNIVHKMMAFYDNDWYEYRGKMDWIQKNYKCCGNDGPGDWGYIAPYLTGHHSYPPTTTTTHSPPTILRVPYSCCGNDNSYNNLSCAKYYRVGCGGFIREMFLQNVMIIGTVALAFSVFDILGIALSFLVSGCIRKRGNGDSPQVNNAAAENEGTAQKADGNVDNVHF